MPRTVRERSGKVGILYDNISGNTGDVAVGLSLKKILRQRRVEFDELVPGRFNPHDYDKIIIGGGLLLRQSPDFFYDKFRITGEHILNACGIEGSLDDLQYLDKYAYVSVRSTGDRKKLDYLNREVKVVPCTSMLLEDCKHFSLQTRSPSIGIHLTPGFLDQRDEENFTDFISKLDLSPYFLPITHYQQDTVYLNRLRLRLPDSKLIPILRPQEIFTLIGKFDYLITMSLHGALFAYVHNVPFIVIDREKTRDFMRDRGLEQYLFTNLASMKQTFSALVDDSPDYSRRVANDYRILGEHVSAITRILPKTTGVRMGELEREKHGRHYLDELNTQIQYLQLQTEGLARQIRFLEDELLFKSVLASAHMKPIKTLIDLYSRRRDLQSVFPEVKQGNYLRLVQWARDAIVSQRDADIRVLMDHAKWYNDNEWLGLGQQIEALNVERSQLAEQLTQTKTDLTDIRHSFGYKFMRFYTSHLHAWLPDGTRRGELRKIAVRSMRVLSEEGARNFIDQALDKIRRREFRVLDPGELRIIGTNEAEGTLTARPTLEDMTTSLEKFLSHAGSRLVLPNDRTPLVSIVVVTYNKAPHTFECIRNLLAGSLPPCEVIVVDNASSDETPMLLKRIVGARVIKNKANRFFGPACNQGANKARGEYLLFLNSDTFVHSGCVTSLANTMVSSPKIGAAGAKLVSPEGRLREAGSIVWQDGSALGYGRGDDPSKPEYCYRRDVDYCSAACLMVRRDLFDRLGGFDEIFVPAYYEDTDLCMRLWAGGFRVVYDPSAVATHVEFAASSFEKAVELMAKHQAVFRAKHRSVLGSRLPLVGTNIIKARDRTASPTILVIDDCVPKPDEGSGFPRMFNMLKSMASLGYRVTLLPLDDPTPKQPETNILNQMGVEVMWGGIKAQDLLETRTDCYDIVLISRPHNALATMNLVRRTNPRARLIYDAEALWHRREQLRHLLGLPAIDPRFESEEAELSLIRAADYVVAVSNSEKRLIQERLGYKERVILLAHSHAIAPTQTPFQDRHGLLFVGGFKSAPCSPGPNDDAAVYFAKTIFPRIQEKIPGIRFIIAGGNPPESVRQLASDSISVLGYFEDLKELYAKSRVFVAPIRFGAGTMWKVTEAMSHGLPCVLSTVAAEGVEITDGEEALVANGENEFVEKTIRLYQDKTLWSRIREHELEYIAMNCDPSSMQKKLGDFLRQVLQ